MILLHPFNFFSLVGQYGAALYPKRRSIWHPSAILVSSCDHSWNRIRINIPNFTEIGCTDTAVYTNDEHSGDVLIIIIIKCQKEAQLMLTNPRNAFRGQSRSPNIVPFHMLGIFPLL